MTKINLHFIIKRAVLILLCITCIASLKSRTFAFLSDPSATSVANSNSLAAGNFAGTVAGASAKSTAGDAALGVAQANAATGTVNSQANAVAVAAPVGDQQTVENNVIQATSQTLTQGNVGINVFNSTQSTEYNQNQFIATNDDGEVGAADTIGSEVNTTSVYKGGYQTIVENDQSGVKISGNTATGNDLLTTYGSNSVTIEIDSQGEKLIIEKIIKSDNRVIIVSAAKFLIENLAASDKLYIQHMINTPCNCPLVQNYVMELLAEGI